MNTARSIGTSRRELRVAGAVMERALREEDRIQAARAARKYAAALAGWRRSIVAAVPSGRSHPRRVA